MLSPRSGALEDAVAHARAVCSVNATERVNVDDFLPLDKGGLLGDPLCLWAEGGGSLGNDGAAAYARSPGGTSLPARRSLLNHSCRANTATLHLIGG